MRKKTRLKKLAETIRNCEASSYFGDDDKTNKFNMFKVKFSCGAPACIKGWAEYLFNNETIKDEDEFEEVKKLLGLNNTQLLELCYPETPTADFTVRMGSPKFITPERAADTILHFAETGIIDWERTA